MSNKEMKALDWMQANHVGKNPYALVFSDGLIAFPSMDEELNNAGVFYAEKLRKKDMRFYPISVKSLEGKEVRFKSSRKILTVDGHYLKAYSDYEMNNEGHILYYSTKTGDYLSFY